MESRRSPPAATMRAPETVGRSMVKVTGSVTDSPGARLFRRAEGVWNLTPGVGLSQASSVVAEPHRPSLRPSQPNTLPLDGSWRVEDQHRPLCDTTKRPALRPSRHPGHSHTSCPNNSYRPHRRHRPLCDTTQWI